MKIWNLTDDPTNDFRPRAVMVGGHSILPGHSVRVSDDVAAMRRVQGLVESGMLHIGNVPPPNYMKSRNRSRVAFPDGHVRGRSLEPAPVEEVSEEGPIEDQPEGEDEESSEEEDSEEEPKKKKTARRRRKKSEPSEE